MVKTEHLSKSISYPEYLQLLEKLMAGGKTTGLNRSEEYLGYTKINLQRMRRLDKTIILNDELKSKLAQVKKQFIWLVITEGWCGDASQNIPVLYTITKQCPNIQLKLVLRDENTELINRYHTNGSASIPKLICLEKNSLKEIFVWGPRPKILQDLVMELKSKNVSKEEKGLITQKWYNNDKTQSVQKEFLLLLNEFLTLN